MWRWTAVVVLTVLQKQILSQPVLDNGNNDRPTVHLELESSCSCEDLERSPIRRDARYEDTIEASSEDLFTRSRDFDDCPCRRESDLKGSPSLLFPNVMRAAGSQLRPEKKGEPKPIFNPEVDLASSVLEQLRVATDEEYQDALARDAAKSAARAVEDFVFGDATPQESANIVTVVVHPKTADDEGALLQASNIKQSRCIHPLQRASRLSSKRPYNRNLYDFDSDVGASNFNENVVALDGDEITKTNPITNMKSVTSDDVDDNCNVNDLRSSSVQSKYKDFGLGSSPLLESIKNKLRPLSRARNFKLQNTVPEESNSDLSPASSVIQEQATKRVPFVNNNSKLDTIRQKSSPLSITNLLNLRDVELVPLKDLLNKKAKRNKFIKSESLLPSSNEQDEGQSLTENGNRDTDWTTTPLTLRNNEMQDGVSEPKSSASVVNYKITPLGKSINRDNCNNEKETREFNSPSQLNYSRESNEVPPSENEQTEEEISSEKDAQNSESETTSFNGVNDIDINKFLDSDTSPSIINSQITSKENEIILNSCEDADVSKAIDANSDENQPKSTEILETITDINKQERKIALGNVNECAEDRNGQDSITDSSNAINTIDKTLSFKKVNLESPTDDSKVENVERANESNNMKGQQLLNPIDKTISDIKTYILMKKEDLNNIKTSLKNRNSANHEGKDNNVSRNLNEDSENEASILITTVQPDVLNEELEVNNKLDDIPTNTVALGSSESDEDCVSNEVSMQDLQKISDSMLQEEERKSSNIDCTKPLTEEKVESSSKEADDLDRIDSDGSASETEPIVETEDFHGKIDRSDESNACKTDLTSQRDANGQASEMVMNIIPKASEIIEKQSALPNTHIPKIGLLKTPLKDINDALKPLNPLNALDNIKDKFTKLFDKSERDTETTFHSLLKPKQSEPFDIFKPLTKVDAGSTNSLLKTPLLRLSEAFEVTQKPGHQISPNLELQSQESTITLPKGFKFKPTFEDNNANESYLKSRSNIIDQLDPLNDMKENFFDSTVEASNKVYSSLKNTQNAVESKLRQITNNNRGILKSPAIPTSGLLDTLSQNHEDMNNKLKALHMDFNDRVESMRNDLLDAPKLLTSGFRSNKPGLKAPSIFEIPSYDNVNDKLRAIHMDFNDRMESMRNDIIDKSNVLTGGLRGAKPSFRSSNNYNKHNVPLKKSSLASTRKDHKLVTTARKQAPGKISSSPKSMDRKKLRMPAAASVPVPRTVPVPELKTTRAKLPPTLRTVSPLPPYFNRHENEDSNLAGRASNLKLPSTLRDRINLKQEKNIKVSFSTTPRPEMFNAPSFRSNTPKGKEMLESRRAFVDHSVSPSEARKIKDLVLKHDKPNQYRNSEIDRDDRRLLIAPKLKEKSNFNMPKTTLRSWPKATESAFLSKVKDAVRERLSNVNSEKGLRQPSPKIVRGKEAKDLSLLKSDMARSASENKEIVGGGTLKENVSYKCKMVCTKD